MTDDFTITYERLGTIHPREQMHALIADLGWLNDLCGPYYVTGAILTLRTTNEWGDPVVLRKPGGKKVQSLIDTIHYNPACRDYDL